MVVMSAAWGVVRGHRPERLPVVLTEDEVRRVLSNLQGTPTLVAQNLYGSELRLSEYHVTGEPQGVVAVTVNERLRTAKLQSDACNSARSRHPQARRVSHIAPSFCHPPTEARLRYPYNPGATWS
jgi:hypothetical protein